MKEGCIKVCCYSRWCTRPILKTEKLHIFYKLFYCKSNLKEWVLVVIISFVLTIHGVTGNLSRKFTSLTGINLSTSESACPHCNPTQNIDVIQVAEMSSTVQIDREFLQTGKVAVLLSSSDKIVIQIFGDMSLIARRKRESFSKRGFSEKPLLPKLSPLGHACRRRR